MWRYILLLHLVARAAKMWDMRIFGVYLILLACALSARSGPPAEGLFVTLQTTMGDIRIDLEFGEAPRTCANFLSLVEGTRSWLDLPAGRPVERSLYTGTVFHRVATNSFIHIIQSGSPTGLPNGSPGYRFNDEFSTNLRHDVSGTVSMANSGPNSNGSQFFITVGPATVLDFDVAPTTSAHAVFGYVVEGLDVVTNIGSVATSPPGDGRPIVDVVTTNVIVERIGSAADMFDPLAVVPSLPMVQGIASELVVDASGNYILDWQEQDGHEVWLLANNLLENELGWQDIVIGGGPVSVTNANVSGIVTNFSPIYFTVVETQTD